MTDITVMCEPEHLPRVRLLQSHLEALGITLNLVDEAEPGCERVLLVPRSKNSRLAETADSGSIERIVLYLDEDPEPIAADETFAIPAWPARSSDADVERLAHALAAPLRPASAPSKPVDRTNQVALGVFALLAAALFAVVQLGSDEAAETQSAEKLTKTASAPNDDLQISLPGGSAPGSEKDAARLRTSGAGGEGHPGSAGAQSADDRTSQSGAGITAAPTDQQADPASARIHDPAGTEIKTPSPIAPESSATQTPPMAHDPYLKNRGLATLTVTSPAYTRQRMHNCTHKQSWQMEFPLYCEALFDEREQRFR